MATVTVQGVAAMKAKVAKVRPLIEKAAEEAMETGANEVVAMMQRLVPRGTEPLKQGRTMRVWESIGWTWGDPPPGAMILGRSKKAGGGGRKRITIFAGGEGTMVGRRRQFNLARLVEFGTVAMAANPYFLPSWRVNKRRISARITRNMRTALNKGIA